MKRIALSLVVGWVAVGLVGCRAATPNVKETAPSAYNDASVVRSEERLAPNPPPCAGGQPLTKDAGIQLLVSLTGQSSENAATGSALDYMRWTKSLEKLSWPADDTRSRWESRTWLDVQVTPLEAGDYTMTLSHRGVGGLSPTKTEFAVTCVDGHWKAKSIDVKATWLQIPQPLAGQDGELTSDLAMRLVTEAVKAGPAVTQVVTGVEFETARLRDLRYVRGWVRKPYRPWTGSSSSLRLEPVDAAQIEGQWLTDGGVPTGERVRFRRVDGLWKVENHTEKGQWLAFPTDHIDRLPFPDDAELLGIRTGMSKSEVEATFGKPSRETTGGDAVYHYDLRRVEVRFDATGRVESVTIKTGSTYSGIRIGSPATLVEAIYGRGTDYRFSGNGVEVSFGIAEGHVSSITVRIKP